MKLLQKDLHLCKLMYVFWLGGIVSSTYFLTDTASAQVPSIVTDGTTFTSPVMCSKNCTIRGGLRSGINLFQSFSNFNVDSGATVLFFDPGVTNILSRVTGNSPSNINGTLGVTGGDANLFLVNSNGIIFGPNARLSTNGSFISSTADAIQFGGQGLLKTTKTQIPQLTINPSALIFNQQASSININGSKLTIPDNKSLLLIGGSINLNNALLNSAGGHVELGGLAEPGIFGLNFKNTGLMIGSFRDGILADVTINASIIDVLTGNIGERGGISIYAKDLKISTESTLSAGLLEPKNTVVQAGDIKLYAQEEVIITEESVISTSSARPENSGDVRIKAQKVTLNSSILGTFTTGEGNSGDVYIKAQKVTLNSSNLATSTTGEGNSGDVYIKAQKVALNSSNLATFSEGEGNSGGIFIQADDGINLDSESSIASQPEAEGDGGKISLTANELNLSNQSEISSTTFGEGNTGSILVNASKKVMLDSGSSIAANVQGVGDGLKIEINTPNFSLTNGSQVVAAVAGTRDSGPAGNGRGGNIKIFAKSVNISGFNPNLGFSSGLITSTDGGATGPAGEITVDTDTFRIMDAAIVSAQTFNSSPGGNISIKARQFEALRGGQILTTTDSGGNAGTIRLDVTDSILLDGSDPTFSQRKAEFPDIVQNEGPASGLFASSRPGSEGKAGSISIDPQTFIIRDGAQIAVNSQGTSPAGNISLQAGNLTLDRGTISATSTSGKGGDISLDIDNLLLLTNNSEISATAGNQNTNGDGGNVTINTDLFAALQNSDITANAFTGDGGKIQITTRGIFRSPDSDISASSEEGGIDGIVEINNPEVDPSESLTELPESVDPPQEIAQGCRPGQSLGGSTFVNIGRGGLPQGPQEAQTPPSLWQDLRAHNLQPSTTAPTPTSLAPPPEIVEAKGWAKDTQGRIYLTASAPQPSSNPLQPTPTC